MHHPEPLFFYHLAPEAGSATVPEPPPPDLEVALWRPHGFALKPRDFPAMPFAVWCLFHHSRLFANRDYAILTLRHQGVLVHRSCLFPPYFRFPFMQPPDLQIGDTWTRDAYRGRGLAAYALREAVRRSPAPGRGFWYLCESTNRASVRVAEKAGFSLRGSGTRSKRFGLRLLGTFDLRAPAGKSR